jgi:hypothetical protein
MHFSRLDSLTSAVKCSIVHTMRGTVRRRKSKANLTIGARGIVVCTAMHDNAPVPLPQVTTSDYPEDARQRLGVAVTRAREGGGWKRRKDLADRANISLRSLVKLEQGKPGVGRLVLEAVGRTLPDWTEDTPRSILDGGPIPSGGEEAQPADQLDRPKYDFSNATLADLHREYTYFAKKLSTEDMDRLYRLVEMYFDLQIRFTAQEGGGRSSAEGDR